MIRNPADSNFTGFPICRWDLRPGSLGVGVSAGASRSARIVASKRQRTWWRYPVPAIETFSKAVGYQKRWPGAIRRGEQTALFAGSHSLDGCLLLYSL